MGKITQPRERRIGQIKSDKILRIRTKNPRGFSSVLLNFFKIFFRTHSPRYTRCFYCLRTTIIHRRKQHLPGRSGQTLCVNGPDGIPQLQQNQWFRAQSYSVAANCVKCVKKKIKIPNTYIKPTPAQVFSKRAKSLYNGP